MKMTSIILEQDAYEMLAKYKRRGQTLSQAIRELIGSTGEARQPEPDRLPRIATTGDLQSALATSNVSDELLDDLESVVRERDQSKVRVV